MRIRINGFLACGNRRSSPEAVSGGWVGWHLEQAAADVGDLAVVLRWVASTFEGAGPAGGDGGLARDGAEVARCLSCREVPLPFAGVASQRGAARPGGQVARRGEPGHVRAVSARVLAVRRPQPGMDSVDLRVGVGAPSSVFSSAASSGEELGYFQGLLLL